MKPRIVGLILLLSCCGQQQTTNKDISELRKKLPTLDIPLEFNSDRMVKWKAVELPDTELISKLQRQDSFTLLGKVFATEDYVSILGYIPDAIGTPVLITFDNEGNELSRHLIFENAMGDMGRYTTNIVTIQPDRQIFFTDSTTTRQINSEGTDEIPGTDSVSVMHKKYRIDDSGAIKRVD